MSARTPRLRFSNPFVITLAAVPACFVQSSTPPSQPVAQAEPGQPTIADPTPTPPPPQTQSPTLITNPPRPTAPPPSEPPPPPPREDPPSSRPPVIVNPPRPAPPPASRPPVIVNPPRPASPPPPAHDPAPKPHRPILNPPRPQPPTGESWMISRTPRGCEAMAITQCPPKVMCNPPPPRPYTCVDGVKYPLKITRVGTSCRTEPAPQPPCPANARCKQPEQPRQVACPT